MTAQPPGANTLIPVRTLLVSTYELGHQPLHVASPAARLRAAGHEAETVDLAVDAFEDALLDDVEAVAVSVPMHTAMRLAQRTVERVRAVSPGLPVAVYGLYADMGVIEGVDRVIVGEYEDELVSWIKSIASGQATSVGVMCSGASFVDGGFLGG